MGGAVRGQRWCATWSSFAEVLLNGLVHGDREVRRKIAVEDGFTGVLGEVVLDAVPLQDMQRDRVWFAQLNGTLALGGVVLAVLLEVPSDVAVEDDDGVPAAIKPPTKSSVAAISCSPVRDRVLPRVDW